MVTQTMETRSSRKRRWQSSPGDKTARAELDFGHLEGSSSPPIKKLAKVTYPEPESTSSDEDYYKNLSKKLGVGTFYGGREKKSFPHSPKRRRAVDKLLEKLSDENSTSESDTNIRTIRGHTRGNNDHKASSAKKSRKALSPVVNHRNIAARRNSTPGGKSVQVWKIEKECKPVDKIPTTPQFPEKKFFKHKSPGSVDKSLGSVIVRSGFDFKFVPRRLSGPMEKKKSSSKKAKDSPQQKRTPGARNSPKTTTKGKINSLKQSEADSGTDSDVFLLTENESYHIKEVKEIEKLSQEKARKEDVLLEDSGFNSGEPIESGQSKHCQEIFGLDKADNQSVGDGIGGSEELFSQTGSIEISGQETPNSEHISEGRVTPLSGITESTTVMSASWNSPKSDVVSDLSGPSSRSATPDSQQKLYSIFTKKYSPTASSPLQKLRSRSSPRVSPLATKRGLREKDKKEQMIIDAGQKKIGAVHCEVCGMVYTPDVPTDSTTHDKFHKSLVAALKFPGWKKENAVQEYPDTGARVIVVTDSDKKFAVKKVEDINKIMAQELGFPEPNITFRSNYKAFLYVSDDKQIEGCCIAEPVNQGYRVLPESQSSQTSQNQQGHRPWCCSTTPEPASVGISKIWVCSQQRKKGIATRLLDCVRQWFMYGVLIDKDHVAFSDPTPDGKMLATKYTGTPLFLVYKFEG